MLDRIFFMMKFLFRNTRLSSQVKNPFWSF